MRIAIKSKIWDDCYDYYPATMHSPFSKTGSTTRIKIMFDFQLLPIVTVEAAGFHSNLVPHVILHIKGLTLELQRSTLVAKMKALAQCRRRL